MLALLSRQVRQFESDEEAMTEKGIASLGRMVQTLEKLTSLNKKEQPVPEDELTDREVEELRAKLIKRIDDIQGG